MKKIYLYVECNEKASFVGKWCSILTQIILHIQCEEKKYSIATFLQHFYLFLCCFQIVPWQLNPVLLIIFLGIHCSHDSNSLGCGFDGFFQRLIWITCISADHGCTRISFQITLMCIHSPNSCWSQCPLNWTTVETQRIAVYTTQNISKKENGKKEKKQKEMLS